MPWVAGLVRSALDMSLSMGRAAAGVRGPLKAWRKKALQRIFEAGDSLRLQFPLEDLGFRYSMRGAAVCLPQAAANSEASSTSYGSADSAAQNLRSPHLEYVQNTEPGSRLPHCAIKLLSDHRSSNGQATGASFAEAGHGLVSTHDLLDPSSTSLLLLIGQDGAAAKWAAAAQEIDRASQIIKTVQILEQSMPGEKTTAPAQQAAAVAEDVSGRWKTLRQVTSRTFCSICMSSGQALTPDCGYD